MSVQTLYTAATGMESLQTKLDVLANNLANVNTIGFKSGRANFEDLFYRHEKLPGSEGAAGGGPTPTGISVGLGSRVSSTQTNFKQGAFQETGGQLDMAIVGEGFFKVTSDGETFYTRAGNFSKNANGDLVMGSANTGRILDPGINIPREATDIAISDDGTVQYRLPPATALATAGQIQLSIFQNPEGLLNLGDNLYAETDSSGTETPTTPGQTGAGIIRQGVQEASNVEPVKELIDLITTQRAFELNSQTVQAGDQILQLIANLRR